MTETPGVLRNDVPIWPSFVTERTLIITVTMSRYIGPFLDIYCGSELIAQESFP